MTLVNAGSDTTANLFIAYLYSNGIGVRNDTPGANTNTTLSSSTTNKRTLLMVSRTLQGITVTENATNTIFTPKTDTLDIGTTNNYIGTNFQTNSNFSSIYCEFICFNNTVLSETIRQSIEGYLASKWGFKSSLPTNHPYYSVAPTSLGWAPLVPFMTKVDNPATLDNRYSLGTKVSFSDPSITNTFTTGGTTTILYVKLWGAGGRGETGFPGGDGAFISGLLHVKPNTTYTIKVGYGGEKPGSTNVFLAGSPSLILLNSVELVIAGGGGSAYYGERRGKASPGIPWYSLA
jgi:hypothetical protein